MDVGGVDAVIQVALDQPARTVVFGVFLPLAAVANPDASRHDLAPGVVTGVVAQPAAEVVPFDFPTGGVVAVHGPVDMTRTRPQAVIAAVTAGVVAIEMGAAIGAVLALQLVVAAVPVAGDAVIGFAVLVPTTPDLAVWPVQEVVLVVGSWSSQPALLVRSRHVLVADLPAICPVVPVLLATTGINLPDHLAKAVMEVTGAGRGALLVDTAVPGIDAADGHVLLAFLDHPVHAVVVVFAHTVVGMDRRQCRNGAGPDRLQGRVAGFPRHVAKGVVLPGRHLAAGIDFQSLVAAPVVVTLQAVAAGIGLTHDIAGRVVVDAADQVGAGDPVIAGIGVDTADALGGNKGGNAPVQCIVVVAGFPPHGGHPQDRSLPVRRQVDGPGMARVPEWLAGVVVFPLAQIAVRIMFRDLAVEHVIPGTAGATAVVGDGNQIATRVVAAGFGRYLIGVPHAVQVVNQARVTTAAQLPARTVVGKAGTALTAGTGGVDLFDQVAARVVAVAGSDRHRLAVRILPDQRLLFLHHPAGAIMTVVIVAAEFVDEQDPVAQRVMGLSLTVARRIGQPGLPAATVVFDNGDLIMDITDRIIAVSHCSRMADQPGQRPECVVLAPGRVAFRVEVEDFAVAGVVTEMAAVPSRIGKGQRIAEGIVGTPGLAAQRIDQAQFAPQRVEAPLQARFAAGAQLGHTLAKRIQFVADSAFRRTAGTTRDRHQPAGAVVIVPGGRSLVIMATHGFQQATARTPALAGRVATAVLQQDRPAQDVVVGGLFDVAMACHQPRAAVDTGVRHMGIADPGQQAAGLVVA